MENPPLRPLKKIELPTVIWVQMPEPNTTYECTVARIVFRVTQESLDELSFVRNGPGWPVVCLCMGEIIE